MVVITRGTTQSIRVTRASCSLAFRVGGDQDHQYVPYVRVGRRREMHGVSRGSTTTAATQEVHVPHLPPIRVTRVSSSLAFRVGGDQGHQHVPYIRVGHHREMQQLGKDKEPSVVLPSSLKSFEGVDFIGEEKNDGYPAFQYFYCKLRSIHSYRFRTLSTQKMGCPFLQVNTSCFHFY